MNADPERLAAFQPQRRHEICYLCGLALGRKRDKEHVVARQVFPSGVRKLLKLNLLTLPAHKTCNESYQTDEVYFVHSIGPLAKDTDAGRALIADLREYFKYPEGATLSRRVLGEFRWELNGIYLPPGRVVKTFDGGRVDRVVWKIVRGLFFVETSRFVPEHTLRRSEIYTIREEPEPGPTINRLRAAPGHTKHPGVFDYKCIEAKSEGGHLFHMWALLFWDALMWLMIFHDPACGCDGCLKLRATYPIPPGAD